VVCLYPFSRVVDRNVAKQTLHWIDLAASLTLSCDFAEPLASFALRSRFCAALAPLPPPILDAVDDLSR
jgi:hypothetical protein